MCTRRNHAGSGWKVSIHKGEQGKEGSLKNSLWFQDWALYIHASYIINEKVIFGDMYVYKYMNAKTIKKKVINLEESGKWYTGKFVGWTGKREI